MVATALVPSETKWKSISNEFMNLWQFPLCLGAIDGKHISIRAPPKSGSKYFNYKRFFSIVLMAVVDANYKFILVDIGAFGSESDGGIFSRSAINKSIENGTLNIPNNCNLPNTNTNHPYTFIGDEAFPLKPWLMRPFPGKELDDLKRIYNYRLSRARRVVENAFGILAARWRIYKRPIEVTPKNAVKICKATIVLHNFLKSCDKYIDNSNRYVPQSFVDRENEGIVINGDWRTILANEWSLHKIRKTASNMHSSTAKTIRSELTDYFISDIGSVPWQNRVINEGLIPDNL